MSDNKKKRASKSRGDMSKPYARRYSDQPRGRLDRAITFRDDMMEACNGPLRINDAIYRAHRRALMESPKTRAMLPAFIRDAPDGAALWQLLQKEGEEVGDRRQAVWEGFVDLLDYMSIGHRRPSDPLTDDEMKSTRPSYEELGTHMPITPIVSSSWTGRRTVEEQRMVVMQLAPHALDALQALIIEQENRLHNYPPEGLPDESMQALRDLHTALGELLAYADGGLGIKTATDKVRKLVSRAFAIVKETGELVVGGLPVMGAASIIGWGTFAMCEFVVGLEEGSSATMAAAAMAASAVRAGRQTTKPAMKNKPTKTTRRSGSAKAAKRPKRDSD